MRWTRTRTWTRPATRPRPDPSAPALALDALVVRERLELVLDPHEVGLIAHHDVDRLVRLGRLVEQRLRVGGLPGAARHLRLEALDRQGLARLGAAHPTAGPVRAPRVRRRLAEPD